MRTVDVIILKGGKTAKEINYLGEKPVKGKKGNIMRDMREWKNIEAKRRTFEIDFSNLIDLFSRFEKIAGGKVMHAHYGYEEGAHHKAQILHSGKIKIL